MDVELKAMSFVAACKTFFGLKPNQTLVEFVKEIKEFTEKDRADMVQMFRTVGIDATKTA